MENPHNIIENVQMYAPAPSNMSLPKKHIDLVALIDADKLKHLVAYDVYSDLKHNIPRDPHRLAYLIEERIAGIFSNFSAKGYIFCFSGKSFDTFRSAVAIEKKYKGSRENDPTFYEGKIEDMAEVVRTVMKTYPVLLFKDLEADDVLCYLQCDQTFIYSNDKDLNQIPGWHFDAVKRDVKKISEEEAHRNLCYQLIVGDSTDCIPGLPGYGAVKAQKIIDSVPLKSLIQTILHEYHKVMGITHGTDAFVETWNLVKLRVCRGKHFNEKYIEAKNLLNEIIRSS